MSTLPHLLTSPNPSKSFHLNMSEQPTSSVKSGRVGSRSLTIHRILPRKPRNEEPNHHCHFSTLVQFLVSYLSRMTGLQEGTPIII